MIESNKYDGKRAKNIFEAIYDDSPIGIELFDSNGKLFDVNHSCMELFGVQNKDKIKGFDLFSDPNIPPEYLLKLKQHKTIRYESIFDFDLVKSQNLYNTTKSGKIYLDVLITPLFLNNMETISNYLVQVQDITSRKNAEQKLIDSKEKLQHLNKNLEQKIIERTEELEISEEEFRMLFENANDAIFLHEIYDDNNLGKFIKVNEKACQMFGYNNEELLKMTPYDLNEPTHLNKTLKVPKTLREKGDLTFETVDIKKNGEKIDVEASSHLFWLNGKNMALTIVREISERKRSEKALIESEERFRSTFELAPVGIAHTTINGTFLRVNQRLCDIVKYSYEELINLTFQEITHPKDLDEDLEYVSQVLDNKIQRFSMEKRYICKDNSIVWINLTGSLVREPSGEPKYFIAIIEDINEKKISEQKLRDSEKKYKELSKEMEMILDHIPGLLFYKDSQNNFIRVNKYLADAHNKSKEELMGRSLFDLYPKQEAQAYWDDDLEVIKTGKSKLNIVEPWDTAEGRKWVLTSKIPIMNEKGNVSGIIGFSNDITEQKNMEEEVRISEHKLKTLMEAVPVGISISSPEGKILETNSEAVKMFGYTSKEQMLQTPARDFYYYEEERDLFVKLLEKNGYVKDFEFLSKRTDGSRMWLSMSSAAQTIGVEVKYINSFQDITERKKAEEKLSESEDKFRTIAEQSSLGITITFDGKIIFSNLAVSNIIEYSIEEIFSWSAEEATKIIHQDDLPFIMKLLRERQFGDYDTAFKYSCRILTKSGKIKWVEIHSKPIIYLNKKAILSSMVDITNQKEVEENLKEINRLKSDLLSRTSHELKTPLVSIKGYADLLLQQRLEEFDFYTISILHEIKSGCFRLESLIKDLLKTSKLESGEMGLNKSKENLSFLIRFCLNDLQGLVANRNHELILEIQDSMITRFEKERIYEVLMNLLSNSIKYTPPKGIIKINSEIRENLYIISVKDNGIGLTEEEITKIFKKFGKIERYGKGLDVISEGSGLGLYISKKIVELHGGNIWVESEGKNKGCTFFFSLPIL